MRANENFPFPKNLTRRELEVARLITRDLSRKEIAEIMCVSHRTVQTHISNICGKIGVRNQTGIAIYVIEREGVWKNER